MEGAQILAVDQTQVDAFADDPGVVGDRRTDDLGGEYEGRVCRRTLRPRALRAAPRGSPARAGKRISQASRSGVNRPDRNGFARLRLPGDDRLGGEVERDAEHVGVFDVEHAVFVQIVGLAAQGAANYLLAQELRAERAHPENVGDGARVPALGEHRHRYHAAGGAAQPVRHPHGVHHFAQQVLVGKALGLAAVAGARDDLPAKTLDLIRSRGPEVLAERFPGVELFAVDQQGVRLGERVAVLVEVAEQLQASGLPATRSRSHAGDETRK